MANRIWTIQQDDGHYDSLDGVALTAGERLYIRWPSGATQPVEVLIDVLHLGLLPCSKAYIQLGTLGGVQAKVYLHGFTAQRLR